MGKVWRVGDGLLTARTPVRLLPSYPAVDDLASLDAAVYHSLVQLKTYQGDVADLALDFTWTVERKRHRAALHRTRALVNLD